MTIVERVRELGLPFGQYVVFGSGTLEAFGIRAAGDIDLAVLPGLYEQLRSTGAWREEIRWGKNFLVQDGIDVASQLHWEAYPTTTEEAIATAVIVEGIPFLNLHELKKFKAAMGRPKDVEDIRLIDSYLGRSS